MRADLFLAVLFALAALANAILALLGDLLAPFLAALWGVAAGMHAGRSFDRMDRRD